MQVFEETNNKTDKVFIMLEAIEAAMMIDAIEKFSKENPRKTKLKKFSSDVLKSIPYKKY